MQFNIFLVVFTQISLRFRPDFTQIFRFFTVLGGLKFRLKYETRVFVEPDKTPGVCGTGGINDCKFDLFLSIKICPTRPTRPAFLTGFWPGCDPLRPAQPGRVAS